MSFKLLKKPLVESLGRCSVNMSTGPIECHNATRIHFLPKQYHHDVSWHINDEPCRPRRASSNSNPTAVRTDDDGNLVSRTILRRDSMQWSTSMLYEPKDHSWMHTLMEKGMAALRVGLKFIKSVLCKFLQGSQTSLNSGRIREETVRRKQNYRPFCAAPRPDESVSRAKFAKTTAARRSLGFKIPPNPDEQ